MIVCICRNLNEKKVREAVVAGARRPKEVLAHHGCQFNCGQCKCSVGDVIADTVESLATDQLMIAAE